MGIIQKIKSLLFPTKKRAVASLLIIGGIIFYVWRTFFPATTQVQYQTAKVERGTLITSVSESGQVAVTNKTSIITQASGSIANVYVKNGDTVTQGQKIADVTLDYAGQQRQAAAWSSYLSAQNTLNTAQAKINSLQSTLFKTNQTFVNGKGTKDPTTDDPTYIQQRADWLQAEADYKNQSAVIAAAQASLSSSWFSYQAASSTVTTPIAGVVADLVITKGMQIGSANTTASTGTGVSSQVIGAVKTDGNPVVSISLSEIDAVRVKEGNKATITFDAFPGKTFTGKVLGINTNGVVSSGVTTYPATILLDVSNDAVLPNMSITADIVIAVKNNVLLVPSASVQTISGQTAVRVMKNGVETLVPVEVGDLSEIETEIISGVSENDEVVTGVLSTQANGQQTTTASPFSTVRFGGLGGGGGAARR